MKEHECLVASLQEMRQRALQVFSIHKSDILLHQNLIDIDLTKFQRHKKRLERYLVVTVVHIREFVLVS